MKLEDLEKLFNTNDEPEVHSINHVSEIPYEQLTDYQKFVNSEFHYFQMETLNFHEEIFFSKSKEESLKALEKYQEACKFLVFNLILALQQTK